MKKNLSKLIVFVLLAAVITIIQISCQKIEAQQNRPLDASGPGGILYTRMEMKNITPITQQVIKVKADTINGVPYPPVYETVVVRIDTSYRQKLYISNRDGSNERVIPIPLPQEQVNLNPAYHPHLTPNADSVVFNAFTGSIYQCSIDGSGLKLLVTKPGPGWVGSPTLLDVK